MNKFDEYDYGIMAIIVITFVALMFIRILMCQQEKREKVPMVTYPSIEYAKWYAKEQDFDQYKIKI